MSVPVNVENKALERVGFSERLKQVLINAEYSGDSPTQLAREFNIRYGGQSITVHAARKWLIGEAIPTQEKLRALAQWFGVSAEWLRYGGDILPNAGKVLKYQDGCINPKNLALLENLERLDDKRRQIVVTLIRQLVQLGT